MRKLTIPTMALALAAVILTPAALRADNDGDFNSSSCRDLPSFSTLRAALKSVAPGSNGGLGFNMWATIVNRDGVVCAVAFTGNDRASQWPGSRVISAQKANTANAFSLTGFALSTANLYAATQPGGSLFGLQESNPVSTDVAYGGNSGNYGQSNDPMVGRKIGGVNVFGGGLALYDKNGVLQGALGVSGDTSCTDHIIAWKTRFKLNFDNVPNGVSPTHDDNMINDMPPALPGHTTSPSTGGFGHPTCDATATTITSQLPTNFPKGKNP